MWGAPRGSQRERQAPSRWRPGPRHRGSIPVQGGKPDWQSAQSSDRLLALDDTVTPHPKKQRPEPSAQRRACWPQPPALGPPGALARWAWGMGKTLPTGLVAPISTQGRGCPCHSPSAVGGHRRWSQVALLSTSPLRQGPGGPGVLSVLSWGFLSGPTTQSTGTFLGVQMCRQPPGGPAAQKKAVSFVRGHLLFPPRRQPQGHKDWPARSTEPGLLPGCPSSLTHWSRAPSSCLARTSAWGTSWVLQQGWTELAWHCPHQHTRTGRQEETWGCYPRARGAQAVPTGHRRRPSVRVGR